MREALPIITGQHPHHKLYGVYTSLNQPETRLHPLPKSPSANSGHRLSLIGRGTLKA